MGADTIISKVASEIRRVNEPLALLASIEIVGLLLNNNGSYTLATFVCETVGDSNT
jgi:hypothetical protein